MASIRGGYSLVSLLEINIRLGQSENFIHRPERQEVMDAFATIVDAQGSIASVNASYLFNGENEETTTNELNNIYEGVINAIETLNGILDKYGEPRIYYGDYSIERVNALIDKCVDSVIVAP